MAKNKVDKSKIVSRLHKLTKSSENIKKMSAYMMQFNRYPGEIGEAWLEAMKKATDDQRKLTLIYVANEIVQTCKKHNAGEFRNVWKRFLPDAAVCLSGCSYYEKIKHIFDIWGQRGIYEPAYIKLILSKMKRPHKKRVEQEPGVSDDIDIKIIDRYKPEEALESLRVIDQLERDEAEVEQISYQLEKSARAEMSTVKGVQESRDLANKWLECANQWETLMDYAKEQIRGRQNVKEILKKAEIFYHAQYKDASVVYKAYHNYGNRISQVKKRTSQQITALSAGLTSYTELVTSLDEDHEPVGDDTPEYVGLESRIGQLCQQGAVSPREAERDTSPQKSPRTPSPPIVDPLSVDQDTDDQEAVLLNHPKFGAVMQSLMPGTVPPPTPNILPGLPPPPPPPPVPTSAAIFPNYNAAASNDNIPGANFAGYLPQELYPQFYVAPNQQSVLYGQQSVSSMFEPQTNFYAQYSQFPSQQQLDDERQKTLEDEFIKRMNEGMVDNSEKSKKDSRTKKSKRKKSRRNSSRSESRDRDQLESNEEEEVEADHITDSVDTKKSKHNRKHKRRSQSSQSNSPSDSRSHKKSEKHHKDKRSVTPSDSSSPRYHSSSSNKKHSKYEQEKEEELPYYEAKHRDKTHKSTDKYRESDPHSHEDRHRNNDTAHSSSRPGRQKHHDSKYEEEEDQERYDSQEEEDYHQHSKRSDHKKEKESKHSRHHSSSSREERKKTSSHKEEQSEYRSSRSSDYKRKMKKESPDGIDNKCQLLQSTVSQPEKHSRYEDQYTEHNSHSQSTSSHPTNKSKDRKYSGSNSDKRRYDTNFESRSGRHTSHRGLQDSPINSPPGYSSPYYESSSKMAKFDDTPEQDEMNMDDYEGGDTPTQDELRECSPPGGRPLGLPLSQPPHAYPTNSVQCPPPNPNMFTCPPPNSQARFLPSNTNLGGHLPPGQVLRHALPLSTQSSVVQIPVGGINRSQMPPAPVAQLELTQNSPSKIAASWGAWRHQSRGVPSLPSLNPSIPGGHHIPSPDASLNLSQRLPMMRHNSGPSLSGQQPHPSHPGPNDSNAVAPRYLTGNDMNSASIRQSVAVAVDSAFPHRPGPPGGSPRIRFNLRLGIPMAHGGRPFPGPRFRGDRPRAPVPYYPNQSKTFRPRDPTQHFLK